MSTNLNKLKLTELIFLAKNVTYKKPEKEFKDFTEDEILYEAVNYGLNLKHKFNLYMMLVKFVLL